jgi:hypothetical protein
MSNELSNEAKTRIEAATGIKVDGQITLDDVFAVIALAEKVFGTSENKEIVGKYFDGIEKHIKETKTKIDDIVLLQPLKLLRAAMGV